MTKEEIKELAFEFVSERASGLPKEMDYYAEILTQFVVEKIKDNGIVWHDLRKDPNDLPKDRHNVIVALTNGYSEQDSYLGYRWDINHRCVVAWCEIPVFNEGDKE